ncbi:MAG: hypothetical protein CMO55_10750 [Verrucomicrobiales bacterium]|nr:hypothetical protein [Verrucomicrobiales bacterium]
MKAYFTSALISLVAVSISAQEVVEAIPSAPGEEDFASLRKSSPFTRVLSLTETYQLRGIASLEEMQVATLFNRQTEKTVVVTNAEENEQGISLVEVSPSWRLNGVTAKFTFGGEEVELKYDETQLSPQPREGGGKGGDRGRRDGRRDGERRGPSPQDIERYKSLSEENQKKLREYVGHVLRSYPNISREERGNMIRGAMIRLSDGRELEIPQQTGGNNGGGGDRQGGGGQGRQR